MAISGAERIKAWRKRQKELNCRALNVFLDKESHDRLKRLRVKYNLNISETLATALRCMEDPLNKVEIREDHEITIQPSQTEKEPQKISLQRNDKGIYQLGTVGDIRIVIEHIYHLRSQGLSYKKITEYLNKERIPTFTGRQQWSQYTVRQLFSSEKM